MARYDSISNVLQALESQSIALGNPASLPTNLPVVIAVWAAAEFARADNHLDEAVILCQQLLRFCPDHTPAMTMLAALQAAYQQAEVLYDHIESDLDTVDLNELMNRAAEARRLYSDHPARARVISKLQPRHDRHREVVLACAAAWERGQVGAALWYLEQAQKINPGSLRTAALIELIQEFLKMRT